MMGNLIGRAIQNASETHSVINMRCGIENHIDEIKKFADNQDSISLNTLNTLNELSVPFK